MCVFHDSDELCAVKKTAKRGRVYGWKILARTGRAYMRTPKGLCKAPGWPGYKYSPGKNAALVRGKSLPRRYGPGQYRNDEAGIHVYRYKPGWVERGHVTIRVSVSVVDLIVADNGQFAARAVHISPQAWAGAKLPKRAKGR